METENGVTVTAIAPFLYAAGICAVGLFTMSILSWYQKYLPGTLVCGLCISSMIIIKVIYNL